MKKGFTMVELLSVIIIIGILSLLITPAVTNLIKDSENKAYNIQIKSIIESADNFAIEYADILPTTEGSFVTIDLKLLKDLALVDYYIKDPSTKKYFLDDMLITLEKTKGSYEAVAYPVLSDTISDDTKYTKHITLFVGSNKETINLANDIKDYVIVASFNSALIDKSSYSVTRSSISNEYQTVTYNITVTDNAINYSYQLKREEKTS